MPRARDQSPAVADIRDELIRLGPWHIEVEVTPELSTRAFLDERQPEGPSFQDTSFVDPRDRFLRTLRRIYPDGLEGRSVLDCACNCGAYLFWAKELGAGRCFGFDVREHWIEQARFLAKHRTGPGEDVSFEVLDLYDLPKLGLERFDVTLFNGIFYHLPDPITGLKIAAEMTSELMIVNTAVKPGFPDGTLVVSEESRSHAMSGVYGLHWFPSGPEVLTGILGWIGFPEIRRNRWRTPLHQPEDLDRIEILAARSPGGLAAFDHARQGAKSAFNELVETSTPPGSTVLVVSGGDESLLELESRTGWRFPPDEAEGEDDAETSDPATLIGQLQDLRSQGARYLAFPRAGLAWLDGRPELRRLLEDQHRIVLRDDACEIFAL